MAIYVGDVKIEFIYGRSSPCKTKNLGASFIKKILVHHNPMGMLKSFGFILAKLMMKQAFREKGKALKWRMWRAER